ncbi:MAG: shikimate kinase [Desulfuromonas sp.]|nr:MAG: shikimate kinase [Desulfuromonas sp.]
MNVVLIGYRGTGKSHVGYLLSQRLGMKLVSMDAEIVRNAGKSIPQVVEEHGWSHFRDLETEEARRLADQDGLIIDCGGGVIERTENTAILKRNAQLFWLKASVPTIVSRIEHDTQRPALTSGKSFTEEVAEVLERRTPLYQNAADCTIDTDTRTPQQVADAIVAHLGF